MKTFIRIYTFSSDIKRTHTKRFSRSLSHSSFFYLTVEKKKLKLIFFSSLYPSLLNTNDMDSMCVCVRDAQIKQFRQI